MYLFCNLSSVYPAVLLIYFISAAVILLSSLALIVQVSLPYNKTGRASVLYNFILVLLRVFPSLHFTLLHFTSLHFTSLHFTSLHFAVLLCYLQRVLTLYFKTSQNKLDHSLNNSAKCYMYEYYECNLIT